MEERIKQIQDDVIRRLSKNTKQLQSGSSWGSYVSLNTANEFIRQTISEVCFFYCRPRPGIKDSTDQIREDIKKLKPGEKIKIMYGMYNRSGDFTTWAHNTTKFRITVKITDDGWEVKRLGHKKLIEN